MEAPPHGSRKPPRAAEAGPDTTRGRRAQAERRAARESAAKSKQEHTRNTPGTHQEHTGNLGYLTNESPGGHGDWCSEKVT